MSVAMTSPPSYRLFGVLFVLGSAACFATMGTIVKDAYGHGATPLGLISLRVGIASLVWLALALVIHLDVDWRSPAVRRLAVAALGGMGLATWSEYIAYQYLPVGVVVVVLFTAPAWIALAERLFRNSRIGPGGMAGLVFALGGLILLTDAVGGTAGSPQLRGFFYALLGSLGVAGFFLGSGDAVKEIGTTRAAAVAAWAPAVVLVPFAAVEGSLVASVTSAPVLGRGAALGIVATMIALLLLLRGIGRLGAFAASIVSATEPVMAAALAWAWLGETLGRRQMFGGALVILGTIVVETWRPPPPALSDVM
jgi:drug/metabolite transporter (DMT)-like permease